MYDFYLGIPCLSILIFIPQPVINLTKQNSFDYKRSNCSLVNMKNLPTLFFFTILNIFCDHVESVNFALFGLKSFNSKSGNYSAVLMSSGSGGSASRFIVSLGCGSKQDKKNVDLLPKSLKILDFNVS